MPEHSHPALATFALALVTSTLACGESLGPMQPPTAQDVPTVGQIALDRQAPDPNRVRALYRSAERTEIADGVAHYRFEVPVGPGEFDVVRLHRVVRERTPGRGDAPPRPVRTDGAVFMTHGASLSFEAVFLHAGTEEPDARTSPAVFLASNGIDVWGMDFGWGLVPRETTDFSFMADWDIERDVDHTLAAMSIARWIRATTGQGRGRMHLLGYSYGGAVAYGAAGRETRQERRERDIRGIVPVELALKYATPEIASSFGTCTLAANGRARLEAGEVVDASGIAFGGLSRAARDAPHEPSAAIPGLTNLQAILFIGANTYVTGPREFWHFVAGDLDAAGIPVGLLHTDEDRWINLGASLPPFMPRRVAYETAASGCSEPDTEDVSFDDHLEEIRVPILYLGGEGGFGSDGYFTARATASDDITLHTVSLHSQRTLDFGHADVILADAAPDLVWDELRAWLVERGRRAPADRPAGPRR